MKTKAKLKHNHKVGQTNSLEFIQISNYKYKIWLLNSNFKYKIWSNSSFLRSNSKALRKTENSEFHTFAKIKTQNFLKFQKFCVIIENSEFCKKIQNTRNRTIDLVFRPKTGFGAQNPVFQIFRLYKIFETCSTTNFPKITKILCHNRIFIFAKNTFRLGSSIKNSITISELRALSN